MNRIKNLLLKLQDEAGGKDCVEKRKENCRWRLHKHRFQYMYLSSVLC